MHRRMTTAAFAVALAGVLAVSACSSKSTDSGGSSSSGSASSGSALQIKADKPIDTQGNTLSVGGEGAALLPTALTNVTCPAGTSLAMAGALTGANAALGINIVNGAQLAIDQFNKANPKCQITLKRFDTEGAAQKATQVAPTIADDKSIVALIGPAFSGETKATGGIFDQAGLPFVTASATNPTLTDKGWKTFFRGLANDDTQGAAVAKYLTGSLGKKKVCVIKDDSDYGIGLAKATTESLGSAVDESCSTDVKTGDRQFSAVVSKVTAANPDAIYYAGYYAEAAPLVQQLRNGGSNALFVSGDGTNDPQFVAQAGDASKGALLTCPCGPAPDKLAAEYKTAFNQAPGVYSVQAYDIATILMKGISEGKVTRPELVDFVRSYNGTGLAGAYEWTPTGELKSSRVWLYNVQ